MLIGPLSGPPRIVAAILCVSTLFAACGSDPTGGNDQPDGPDGAVDPGGPPPGMAACGSAAPLSRFPVPVDQIGLIIPLGAMTAGGHLFPATHLGLVPEREGSAFVVAPLSTPGDITIRTVRRTLYEPATGPTIEDYSAFFFPCADLRMHFGHIASFDPAVQAAIGAWADADCAEPYLVNLYAVTQCSKNVNIELAAGTPLGTMGGSIGALDWGATDRRVQLEFINPSRLGNADLMYGGNNAVCAIDYLPDPVRASVHDLFGDGSSRRSAEPVCGTVMQDIPGTVQGRWFVDDSQEETRHLALVRDFIDPAIAAFSVGSSIPSLPVQVYRFDPETTGRVNLDFPFVTEDGLIYCYETKIGPGLPADRTILIQLLDELTLRIEGRAGTDCGPPDSWSFSAAAVRIER